MEFSHTSSSPMPFLTSFLDSSPQKTSLVKISCKLNKNFRFYNFFSLQGPRDFRRARLFKRRKGPKLQLTVKSWKFELWGWNFRIPPILSSSLSGPNFRKIWAPWFRGWMIYPGMTRNPPPPPRKILAFSFHGIFWEGGWFPEGSEKYILNPRLRK